MVPPVPARCSSCHCYSRNCPEGQPNHRHSAAVGPNCTMNSQGRHFRSQDNVADPVCDYERGGQPCDFFTTQNEFSSLEYPPDISLGPSQSSPESEMQNVDLSQIYVLLQQQKADSARQFQSRQPDAGAITCTPGRSRIPPGDHILPRACPVPDLPS